MTEWHTPRPLLPIPELLGYEGDPEADPAAYDAWRAELDAEAAAYEAQAARRDERLAIFRAMTARLDYPALGPQTPERTADELGQSARFMEEFSAYELERGRNPSRAETTARWLRLYERQARQEGR